MPILFKLAGHINSLEIKRDIIGIIKFSSIVSIFECYGISTESFEYIQFIIDSEIIKDNTKKFIVSNNDNLIIFVNTSNKEIKKNLIDIFLNENELNENELNKPIIDIIQEEKTPELSQEIIDSINIKTVELFKNEDFKRLIEIYYSNPEILKTFLNFVSHGDIIKMSIPILSEEKDYFDEIKMLKTLGINESDDFIKSVLNKFNGHLNLSLRDLLTHECKKSKV